MELIAGSRSLHRLHDAKVWLLTAGVAAAAILLTSRLVGESTLIGAPFQIRFWLLAPFFYLAERTVMHFRFHRHAYSFSLSEIPLTVGLFFATPVELVAAQVIGGAVALVLHRRQRPIKAAFNLAQLGLQAIIAITVFRWLEAGPMSVITFTAAVIGAIAAWWSANGLISAAIILSGGRLRPEDMRRILITGMGAAALNVGLGIVTVALLWLAPAMAYLALIPVAVVYVSYRAYAVQRLEHGRLAAIYEATKELHSIPQLEQALAAVVQRASRVFEAEVAEIVLTPDGPGGSHFDTRFESGEMTAIMTSSVLPVDDPLTLMVLSGVSGYIGSSLRNGDNRVDVIASPLVEGGAVVGAFIVHHPSGDMVEFTGHDLTLLETMSSQVAVSLENGRLEDSLTQLTRLKEELRHQTLHDSLTGLANRNLLQERLERLLQSGDDASAMVFLDLDDFKVVNDNYGHHSGDELLQGVASRVLRSCRDHDTVARIGGDEFAILLTKLRAPSDVDVIANRILEHLAPPFTVGGHNVFTSASIGATYIVAGDRSDDVLRRADHAMYTAKQARKGSFRIFGESMESEARRASKLRNDIQDALVGGGIQLHYQPIVELESGKAVAAEGLIRWQHAEFGPVAPREILSTASDAGLMDLLCAWTIDRAVADAARIQTICPDFSISVNIDADQIRPDLVDIIGTALASHGIPPHTLIVEITENAAIEASPETFDDLASLGIRIALDDFGTGYSSLSRLDTLPIKVVKIDRSFVERMIGPNASPLARMVIEIGHTLGLQTIAEGIETGPQRDHLRGLGCIYGQGYLFAGAIPIDEFDPHRLLVSAH